MQVGSQISGIILALFADFNTKVVKSRFIARLDPLPFQAKADQEQANVDAAREAAAITLDSKFKVRPSHHHGKSSRGRYGRLGYSANRS